MDWPMICKHFLTPLLEELLSFDTLIEKGTQRLGLIPSFVQNLPNLMGDLVGYISSELFLLVPGPSNYPENKGLHPITLGCNNPIQNRDPYILHLNIAL